MSDPIDYVLACLRRAADNAYPWSLTPTEAGLLFTEVQRLRAERHLDNADLAQAYDFARNKGETLEREAVVAWLRVRAETGNPLWSTVRRSMAEAIERGEHRSTEKG